MRLILHQALKDVRLIRWPLLAWVLPLAVFHAITLYALAQSYPDGQLLHRLDQVQSALGLAATAAFILVAVLLVQIDSPSTTTTFWITRPVSGRAMLASKLLTALLLLCVLPAGAQVLDLAAGGLPVRSFSFFPLASALAWLLTAMAIAAITVTLAQFVLIAIIELLLVALCLSAAAWGGTWPAPYAPDALVCALTASMLALLGYQYLTRRRTQAAVMLGLAPLVVTGLACLLVQAFVETEAAGDGRLQSVSVSVDTAAARLTNRGSTSVLNFPLMLSGVPDDMRMDLTLSSASLAAAGKPLRVAGVMQPVPRHTPTEDERREATRILRSALGGATLQVAASERLGTAERELGLIVRTPDLEPAHAASTVVHLELRLYPWVYRPVATARLQPGASFRTSLTSGRLNVQSTGDRTSITVREVEAPSDPWRSRMVWRGYPRYLLRSERSGRAILLPLSPGSTRAFGYGLFLPGTMTSPLYVGWRRFEVARNGQNAWVEDADLIAVQVERVKELTRTIDLPLASIPLLARR